jgi:hypothetical protein
MPRAGFELAISAKKAAKNLGFVLREHRTGLYLRIVQINDYESK